MSWLNRTMAKRRGISSSGGKKLETIAIRMAKLDKHAVAVGVHEDAGMHGDSGTTVAQIAAWNEYGTSRIPERSFLRTTVHESEKKYVAALRKIVKKSIDSDEKNPKTMMGLFGRQVENDVKKKIVDIREPPNNPATIARKKGVDNPLIDTGQLLNSIRWKFINGDTD